MIAATTAPASTVVEAPAKTSPSDEKAAFLARCRLAVKEDWTAALTEEVSTIPLANENCCSCVDALSSNHRRVVDNDPPTAARMVAAADAAPKTSP
jgi:hypothetical protein